MIREVHACRVTDLAWMTYGEINVLHEMALTSNKLQAQEFT